MIVSKKVSFDAAHSLPYYIGKCSKTHGHHWVAELAVKGRVMNEHGFVVDFSKLKEWLEEHVVERFDHTYLNDTIDNPTAENLVIYIKDEFDKTGYLVSGDVNLYYIKIWETSDSMAEWRKDE